MRSLLADVTPLRNPDYRRLWTSGIVTVVGAQLTVVAVPLQIFAITQNSAYVGLAGLFGLVPLVVFGLWGGALADVMDRRKLIIVTTLGLIGTSVLLWVQAAAHVDNVWLLLCLFSLQQVFFAINSPTRSAIIPRLLPLKDMPAANSLNMTVFQFGAIAGPLLAGVLIPVAGLATVYLIDAVALLATLWAVIRLPALPPTGPARRAGLKAVGEGFTYLATQKVLLASFVVDIVAMVFGMPRALFPQIAHESFGDPLDGGIALGLLFAAMSAGAVLGGVFSGWLPRIRYQGRVVVVCIAAWGVAMIGFGVVVGFSTPDSPALLLWAALAFLAIGGAVDMISAALRSTMLQQVATDDMRGRLQGVFTVVVAGGPRIGDVLHGLGAYYLGTVVASAGGGLLVVIGVVISVLLFPMFLRYRVDASGRPEHA
ncbi:MFS transporter [Prescottella subtropica]|uniref:MFS transporter n=1 Tax=Prescottella subtropica TaxID=2545757 RepID=UPI0010F7FAF9|nr:MFS transporter [Prescottella subtropica]